MEAYAQFYELYSFRIYKHLLAISHGDELAAREVFQSVALKLTRRMEVFDDERRLWSWLQRVTRNAFVDFCRARRRNARFVSLEEPAGPPSPVEPESRMREWLMRLLDECEPAERELLQAFYVDGTPLGELAVQSSQTYKALESRLARLRQKLRAKLLNSLRHED
jgi:RNA polymerase sigma-70 factor (ECF subfamily)